MLGRPIDYPRLSPSAFRARMRAAGHPEAFVRVVARIYLVVRLRLAGRVSPDLAALLGRPPTPLRRYVEDRAEAWTPDPGAGRPRG